mgnify:CR=1 FL=1
MSLVLLYRWLFLAFYSGGSVKVTQNEEKEEKEEEEEVEEEKSSGPNIAVIAPAVGVPVLLIVGVVVYCIRK